VTAAPARGEARSDAGRRNACSIAQEVDEGPIIEQDVTRVTRAHTAAELQARGGHVERAVLAGAVPWHGEDR